MRLDDARAAGQIGDGSGQLQHRVAGTRGERQPLDRILQRPRACITQPTEMHDLARGDAAIAREGQTFISRSLALCGLNHSAPDVPARLALFPYDLSHGHWLYRHTYIHPVEQRVAHSSTTYEANRYE